MKQFTTIVNYALSTSALLLPVALMMPSAQAAVNQKVTPMGAQRALHNQPQPIFTSSQPQTLAVNHKVTPMAAQRALHNQPQPIFTQSPPPALAVNHKVTPMAAQRALHADQ
ncbi:hypothetical protein [Leptolyngbya iicbica]|uniref:Uncharacterized protein n=2 Tax=Cyanophyceae TaxID=3028117 RepID=A0A4Q7E2S0_9CYAN|nr:hypothetical protein [Leptolyngbya sp. LK]RZM76107.1 hypothetical protein DYY88_19675 [Leptolyngbya sp. LK]